MHGEEARKRLLCLQDVARGHLETLLMSFISQWAGDTSSDPRGVRVYSFLNAQNTDDRIYDELKHKQYNNFVICDDGTFQNPVQIEQVDITGLSALLELDVYEFPTRPLKHRRSGVSKLICYQNGHLPFWRNTPCCITCNSCQRCKQNYGIPLCPNQKLRETIQNIRNFRNLIAHLPLEAFEGLKKGTFNDVKFPRCHNFESLSAAVYSYIQDLMDYLLTASSIK